MILPKEKAKELVNNYSQYLWAFKNDKLDSEVFSNQSKKCAIILTNEIITELSKVCYRTDVSDILEYWQEVKKEI